MSARWVRRMGEERSNGPLLGTDIPMLYSGEGEYLVLSVTEFAKTQGADVVGPPFPLPYALCDVEIFSNDTHQLPLPRATLRIAHREDFKLICFLNRLGIIENEDVILRVERRGGILGRFLPVLGARSQSRGTFHEEIEALLAHQYTGAAQPVVLREFEPGPFDPSLWRLIAES